jgi:ankyrin repeat protein
VKMADGAGNTPLHCLAKRGALDIIAITGVELAKKLLEHGADPKVKNKAGETALDLALSSEYALMVDLLEPLEKQDPSQSEFDQTSGLDLGSQNVDTTKNEAEK